MRNDLIFSLINLKIYFALLRVLFYLPLVMILRKKNEKKAISIKNIEFGGNFIMGILNIMGGYLYIILNLRLVYKKRQERAENINNNINIIGVVVVDCQNNDLIWK